MDDLTEVFKIMKDLMMSTPLIFLFYQYLILEVTLSSCLNQDVT